VSEEVTKQAAVEVTEAQAKPAAEAANARDEGDDLDKILSSYDEQVGKPAEGAAKPTPEQKPGAVNDQLVTEVRGALAEINQVRYRQDMDGMIKAVRGDVNSDIADDTLVEAWLDAQARQDPRLQRAWLDRVSNPKQFQKVQQQLAKGFQSKFSKLPDKQATDDREAVAAAVRGTSTKAPEGKAPNYSRLGNNEFAEQIEKDFGFRPL